MDVYVLYPRVCLRVCLASDRGRAVSITNGPNSTGRDARGPGCADAMAIALFAAFALSACRPSPTQACDVRMTLCDAGSNCGSRCGLRILPEVACVMPVAPSGLGVPVQLLCDGARVNATFYDNIMGVCRGSSVWGGSYDERQCVEGQGKISYTLECVPAARRDPANATSGAARVYQ